jgi:hypothetical protein
MAQWHSGTVAQWRSLQLFCSPREALSSVLSHRMVILLYCTVQYSKEGRFGDLGEKYLLW